MTLTNSTHYTHTAWVGMRERSLEHEDSSRGSADEAKTSLEARGSAGRLRERGGAGGRGAQRLGDGHAAGGLNDQGRVGGAGAGDGRDGANALDGGGVGGQGADNGSAGLNDSGARVDGRSGARLDDGGALDGVAAVAVATGGRVTDNGGRDGGRGSGTVNGGRDGGGGSVNVDGLAVVLGDTKLGGVLVLAVEVVNQLETVVGDISLEVGRGSPGEGARVGEADGEGFAERNDVGRGATEKDQGDSVGGGGLPGDLEGLAGRDDLEERAGDGVASRLANGGVLGSDSAGEESNDGGLGVHGVCLVGGLFGWY
jgi:hypothetical protein